MSVTLANIRFYRPPSLPARPMKNICHLNRHTPFPQHSLSHAYPSPSHSDSPPTSPSQPSLHYPLPPRPPVNTTPPLNTCNIVDSEPTILGDFDEEIQDFLHEPAGALCAEEIIPIDPAILDSEISCENVCLGVTSTDRETSSNGQDGPRSSLDPLLSESSLTHEPCLETSNHESGREVVTFPSAGSYLDHDHGDQCRQSSASLMTNLVTDPDEAQGTGESGERTSTKRRQSQTKQDTEQDFGRAAKQPRTGSAPNEDVDSFSALRSHFLTTPLQGRLEFLSWLFEGAISQGMSDPGLARSPPSTSVTERNPKCGWSPSQSRENKPWKPEEIDLLVQLRKKERLPWSTVGKRLVEKFPGRTIGAIQVYWSTKLKDRH